MTLHRGRTGDLDWSEVGGGKGRPLVLIHALGCDRGMWAPQLETLSSTRRVILFDLPGHGVSSAKPGHYRASDLGEDVLDLATAAGVDEFDLGGVSLGGLVTLWMGIEAPDRVRSLVVSNTAARVGSVDMWAGRIAAVESGGMEAVEEVAVARFFSPDLPSTDPDLVEEARRVLLATDPAGYAGCCAVLRDADLRASVGAISRPTLVLGGGQDIATPAKEAIWLGKHIPGSRVRILEEAGHLSNLEAPDQWTAEVEAFLASV